jgi:hypothetical protein
MGNVSHVVPASHPTVAICPLGTDIHTPEFEVAARSEEAQRVTVDVAVAFADVGRRLLTDPGLLATIRAAFEARPQ